MKLENDSFKIKRRFLQGNTVTKIHFLFENSIVLYSTSSGTLGALDLFNESQSKEICEVYLARVDDSFIFRVFSTINCLFYMQKRNTIGSISLPQMEEGKYSFELPIDGDNIMDITVSFNYSHVYVLRRNGDVCVFLFHTSECQNIFTAATENASIFLANLANPEIFCRMELSASERIMIISGYEETSQDNVSSTTALISTVSVNGQILNLLGSHKEMIRGPNGDKPVYFSNISAQRYLDREKRYPLVCLSSSNGSYYISLFLTKKKISVCTKNCHFDLQGDSFSNMQHRKGLAFLIFCRSGRLIMINRKMEQF